MLKKSDTCPQAGCQKKIVWADVTANEKALNDIATYKRRKEKELEEEEEDESSLSIPKRQKR